MILVPFFEIPYWDRLAKNVKSRCVQIILRSTAKPSRGLPKVTFLAEAEFEGGKKFGLRPITEAEAEG